MKTNKFANLKRPDPIQWDDYFMSIALLSAQRSKDPNRQVGACIVDEFNRIVSIGYNGMPNGCDDDLLPWCREDIFYEGEKNEEEKEQICDKDEEEEDKCCSTESFESILENNGDNENSNKIFESQPCKQTSIATKMFKMRLQQSESEDCGENSDADESLASEYVKLENNDLENQEPMPSQATVKSVSPSPKLKNFNPESSDDDDDFLLTNNNNNQREPNPLNTKYPYVCHAELNAILNKSYANLKNCRMYCTLYPCNECTKLIIQSGIKKVIYKSNTTNSKRYEISFRASRTMFKLAKVETRLFEAKVDKVVLSLRD